MRAAAAFLLISLTPANGSVAGYRVPGECADLAAQMHIASVLTHKEARRAVAMLEGYPAWPGVRECRNAAKRDWGM